MLIYNKEQFLFYEKKNHCLTLSMISYNNKMEEWQQLYAKKKF